MKQIKSALMILMALLMVMTAAQADLPTIGGGGTGDLVVSGNTQYSGETSSHTMMIYMIGSNLESEYGAASQDIMEIAQSGANFGNLNVVVAAGGASHWQELSIQAGEVGFGSIRKNPSTQDTGLIWDKRVSGSISSVSMLSQFLDYAYRTFPAQTYSLVFWNHGGGPLVGYGHDEVANNMFSLEQLNTALRNSPFASKKLSWIGFDACLMGSYEVAAALEPFTECMVASEETEPGIGWDYSFVGSPKMAVGHTVAEVICDRYADAVSRIGVPYTISAFDTFYIEGVTRLLNTIFRQNMTDDMKIGLARAAYASQSFGLVTTNSTYDLYDLKHFVENLCYYWDLDSDDTAVLKSMVSWYGVYCRTNMPGAYGLSFYFPLYTDPSRLGAVELYGKFSLSEEYRRYLQTAHGIAAATGVSGGVTRTYDGRSRSTAPGETEEEEKQIYTYQMTEEQQKALIMAEYVILKETEDGSGYDLVRLGTDVKQDENGILSVELPDVIEQQPGTEDSEPAVLTLIEKERAEDETVYFLPAELLRGEKKSEGSLQYFDRKGQKAIGEFVPYDGTDVPPKQLLALEAGDVLTFLTYRYTPAADEDGAILPFTQWTEGKAIARKKIEIGEDMTPLFETAPAEEGKYRLQIIGVEADGTWFGSPLMPFGAQNETTGEEEKQ